MNQNIGEILEENRTTVNNYNDNIDLLLGKIESLVRVNDSLNTKLEDVSQDNKKSVDLLLDKIESLVKVNDNIFKEIETGKQDLLYLINKFKSNIIVYSSFKSINDRIDNSKTIDFVLLYRASENEFSASSFHSACDGKGPTITLIETTDGCVFGGYNNQSWNNDDKWYHDDKCFFFTLVKDHGVKPTKYLPIDTLKIKKTIIGGFKDNGPMFGLDLNLYQVYSSGTLAVIDTSGKGEPPNSFTIKTIEIYKCI
ncbi:hypothetical protein CYY_010045 [Polysphondylium violaceum]|uniref:TLDc domain-containing protein n=1 Tax=Polysphondylium violaceum TaxID=133409 RepID=A0A8J4PKS1_9MYCE|nr:hypothetical protein CYY_010045 [Polysphondylium violaceum]